MPEEKAYSNEYCKYILSEDEKKEIALTMAQKVSEVNQKEADKKSVTSDFTSQINSLTAEVNRSATLLTNGYEMRTIKCEIVADYDQKVFKMIRTDNGEVAKERRMSSDDFQMSLV